MDIIEIKSTSAVTADMTPLVLSTTPQTQTSFEVTQVDNERNPKMRLKGKLIFKKIKKTTDGFDIKKLSKKDIASNEYVELQLSSEETYNLAKGLYDYFVLTAGTKTPFGTLTYMKTDDVGMQLHKILQEHPDALSLISKHDTDIISVSMRIEELKATKALIEANMDNSNESFWQKLFAENAWVISQVFSMPYLFFQDQPYVGGKGIENSSGKFPDFLYKSCTTNNIAVVEIKTPVTQLVSTTAYRADVYAPHTELSGAVSQALSQRDTLYKGYIQSQYYSKKDYEALNFMSILFAGNVSSLKGAPSRLSSFEQFRNELRNIQIIGFDELLEKINIMLALLES